MFTGIVEEVGQIKEISRNGNSLVLNIGCSFCESLTLGESVAVNGICLTVTSFDKNTFCADVTPETFRRTSLGVLQSGSKVNLERAMKADGRFGGHIVSGHIDGTANIYSIEKEDNAFNVSFKVKKDLFFYMIEKGSVSIDGVSLTIANCRKVSGGDGIFCVAVIPHTWANTALALKKTGDVVNIECDVVGKYIEHFVCAKKDEAEIDVSMINFTSFHN